MNSKKASLFIILFFILSIFSCLFSSSNLQAESESVDDKKIELLSSKVLSAEVQYYQTEETIFWTLSLTKLASEENQSLSVDLSSQGDGLSVPQVATLPNNIVSIEGNRFEEALESNAERVYIFKFATGKAIDEGKEKLIVKLSVSSIDEAGRKIILDENTQGYFEIVPENAEVSTEQSVVENQKPLQEVNSEQNSSSSFEANENIETNETVEVNETIETTSNSTESITNSTATTGSSFLETITPFLTNPSLLDPFSYLNDLLGVYPSHNNGVNQGNDVRNYDYSSIDSLPIITGRNRPAIMKPPTMTGQSLNFTTGYHDYSGAYLKKWVEPAKDSNGIITDPTLFNAYLEVIGDSTQIVNPIDIILVLDKSGSMNDSIGTETKDAQLQASVRSFSNSLLNAGLDVKIGLVNYGSESSDGDGGNPIAQTQALTTSTATINNSSVLTRTPIGYTPTDLGLANGLAALYGSGARTTATKIMVFLSDGAPTKYYKPVEVRSKVTGTPNNTYTSWGELLATNNGTTPGVSMGPLYNYDGTLITTNEKFPNKFGPIVAGDPSLPALSPDGLTTYQYRWNGYQWLGDGWSNSARQGMTYTIGYANWLFAQDPKYANVSLYSIGLGIGGTDELSTIGRNTLKNLAKDTSHYFSADTQGQLLTIFTNIAATITKTVQRAHVVDPLGAGVTLVGNPTVNSFLVVSSGTTAWSGVASNDPKLSVTLTKAPGDRGLEWSGLSVGKNEGLRFSYQVRLSEPYQTGLFQQANGETYLENGTTITGPPYDSANRLHFAIPSVRYKELTNLTIKKVWSDNNNVWGLRTPVTLQLQRMISGGTYQDVSGKTLTIQPNATGSQLQTTFTGLEVFNPTGQRYTYQVVENTVPSGYMAATYSDAHLTAVNTLITTNITFKKMDNDGQAVLPNVTFELAATNGNKIQATSDLNGVVTFSGVPIGNYTIKEVTTPTGYQAVPTFKVAVTKVSDTILSTVFDMSGVPAEMFSLTGQNLSVINKYAKGKFSFKKVGGDGTSPLSGVKFDLMQNNSLVQEVTSIADGTVLFNNIYPGNYTLKEVSTVNGYSLISDIPIVVTKNINGLGEFIVQGLPANSTVQNKLKNFSLSLNKVSMDNLQKGIQGAEFSLYYNGNFMEKQVSNATGQITFTQNLEAGKNYTVKETAVPAGYLPITGVFTIQVTSNGQVTISYNGIALLSSQISVALTSGIANNTIQYTVTNDPKRPLPKTGGRSIYLSITAGVLSIMVASFIYQRDRRERKRL